jgi:phospholipase C
VTQYAYRTQQTSITLAPGDVQMYRLPTMMPGDFHLSVYRNVVPPPVQPGQPGSPGAPVQPPNQPAAILRPMPAIVDVAGGLASTGFVLAQPDDPGSPGTVTPPPQPEDLVMDLFHGDQIVASGSNGLPLQHTLSNGDDTWRLRLQLGPGSPAGNYSFTINLMFPSMLPILTRRIPLDFFQQGFDDNWNGRNYISITFENSKIWIHFDPEVASYYGLSDKDVLIPTIPTEDPPNILVKDVNLSVGSSAGSFGSLPGPLPYIRLTLACTGIDNQPITGEVFGFDVKVHDFTITATLYLTTLGAVVGDRFGTVVGYVSEVTSNFESQVYDTNGEVTEEVSGIVNNHLWSAQTFLDQHAGQFGAIFTQWLLGAGFDVWNVRYDPTNSQPVPPSPSPTGAVVPQGDLVIDYVAQLPAQTGGLLSEQPQAPTILTITTGPLATGVAGTPYSQNFTAAAGPAPFTWTLVGALPPGITFTGSNLSGTPSAPGIFNIQVTVRDASGHQSAQAYTFAVNPAGFSITTASPLPRGIAGQPYAIVLAVQGGAAPYTWSATGLPAGLSISPRAVISGTPSGNGGLSTVVVKVTDQHGVAAWHPLSLTIQEAPLFTDPLYAPRGDGDTIWKPPSSASPGLVLPGPATTPGDLSKIDHIVVVMMENRSFDHMLGYLSKEGGRSDVEGLKWENDSNRTQFNYYKGRFYYPQRLWNTQAFFTEAMSPDHSYRNVKTQMTDGMMHFVSNFAREKVGDDPSALQMVMGYYGAEQLPTYDMLARQFAICDHWFCSHPGPTWPNRFVTMTGDLNRDSYGEPEVDTPIYADFTPSEAPTLFDHLSDRGVSWQYFQQRASMMRAFTKYSFDMVNVLEFDDPLKGFAAAAKAGLKSVTFVDPLFGDLPAGLNSPQDNDDAPPSDLKNGQDFINGIVTTLFTPDTNPNWAKTMLLIVYDEHGGFYDHVVPPSNATSLLGQNSGKLGPRVPAFVVSAWTPPGQVLKDTFDHGTIGATILRRFCSPHPPVMSPRVTAALDLRGALSLKKQRGGATPLLGPSTVFAPALRTAIRRFKAPRAADSFGSLLGGLALTLGSTPR